MDPEFLNEVGWTLMSSNGYARVVCTRPSTQTSELLFRVRLEYELPNDAQPTAIADVYGVVLRRSAIEELVTAVTAFVDQAVRDIDPNSFVYTSELADAAGDRLRVSFGPRPDVVTGSTGIACLVEIGRSAFGARMAFRTDTTCLERLAAELDSALLAEPG